MEHVIELMKDEPFKERFRHITPPLVDEVRQHIQEMLDGEAIRPSQSPWCNAMVLVRKKDGLLWFCIDFCHLNVWTKKDACPLQHMQETMECMVGTRHFSYMDLKAMFQHLMQNCLGELNLTYALIYLDDMIVYSKTEEEHLVCLRAMLE